MNKPVASAGGGRAFPYSFGHCQKEETLRSIQRDFRIPDSGSASWDSQTRALGMMTPGSRVVSQNLPIVSSLGILLTLPTSSPCPLGSGVLRLRSILPFSL